MSYVSAILAETGLVGFWELAESSGTTATDQKGNSNGAYSQVGAGGFTLGQTGIVGGGGATATRFTRANGGTVAVPSNSNSVTDTFTYEVWVKRASTGAFMAMVMSPASGSPELRFNNDDKIGILKQGVAQIATSSGTLTDTASWHHIVWTKGGATSKIYVDGVDVTGTVTNATCNAATNYIIGAENAGNYMDGTMAMIAIYNVALTPTQVATHYALGSGVAAPTNSAAPVASGTTTVGSVLTTTDGTWTGSPTFTYQWQRDTAGNLSFSNIGSATANTYTLVDADDGNKIRCVVTGTNSGGNAAANSNAVGLVIEPVPVNTVAPVASGSTTVGSVVSTTNGTWTHQGGSVATYTYQWQRDVVGSGSYSNIAAATSSSYTLALLDDACHVRCVVTATNSGGAGTPANSNSILDTTPVPSTAFVGGAGVVALFNYFHW